MNLENENLKFIFLVTSIGFIVLISGCTTNRSQASVGGVIIENFETDFSKVYSGENFKLQIKIRNIGSVNAYGVYPKLYNINTNIQNKNFEIECKESCTQTVTLLPPDPERGTEGQTMICIWDCIAPKNIPKGLSVIFNPLVRVYYFYKTNTIKSINIISQDELRSLQTRGAEIPSETLSTTSGPVSLEIVVKGPIRYWENENKVKFPININIQNIGNGVVCVAEKTETAKSDLYSFIGCEDQKNWNKVKIFFNNNEDPSLKIYCDIPENSIIELWRGKDRTLTCEIELDVSKLQTGILKKNFEFSIEYDYFIDASTSIEVVGR